MEDRITSPGISLDGTEITIDPNSCFVTRGHPVGTVKPVSSGGSNVEMTHGVDMSTAKGLIRYSIQTTVRGMETLKEFQGVEFSAYVTGNAPSGADVSWTMTSARIVNDPEINLGVDGKIEVRIQGTPLV